MFLPWNAKHFSPTPHFTSFYSASVRFLQSIPPLHTAHTIDFIALTFVAVFIFLSFQILASTTAFCLANAMRLNFFGAISICWLVWSQEFKVVNLLQWFSLAVHLHWNIVLSADHHYFGLLCIDIHVVACTFLYQILKNFLIIGKWCCVICISQICYSKYRNYQKYHDIFAWKYHDTITIYIVDIYHWYFCANPGEKTTKCLWQEASTLRQRRQNSAFNCTQW